MYNQLTSLDVSKNTALTGLMCENNQLTSIDVSKNTALFVLHCNNNQLTSLDVSKNTELLWLWCHSNQLTSLDLITNTKPIVCKRKPIFRNGAQYTVWYVARRSRFKMDLYR
jgi:Leucine-rich repeat (LRR) protein